MRLGILLISLLVLAGCSGDGDSAGEGGPLSRAEYTRKANEICTIAEQKLENLGDFESFEQLSEEMKVGEAALRKSASDLRALRPPRNLRAQHLELADLQDQTADVAQRISAAAKDNDQLEMQKEAERADKLTTSSNEAARKLGLEECVAG